MATYYIEQHLLSAEVSTVIKDHDKKPIFLLVGSWGKKGDSISIYSLDGDILASAKQTSFSFISSFDLFEKQKKVGSLSKLFTTSHDVYLVKKRYWVVLANIKKQKYRIYYLNKKVMDMEKETTYKGNFFRIDITNEKDAPQCFCIAAVLDYWARRGDQSKKMIAKQTIAFQVE